MVRLVSFLKRWEKQLFHGKYLPRDGDCTENRGSTVPVSLVDMMNEIPCAWHPSVSWCAPGQDFRRYTWQAADLKLKAAVHLSPL